ncbi:putative Ig domain-containing protein [Couchioplanes caeruleus]|uniref:putative Ig domain-containing protein n=1 Tax=Couchioplanes caeruleus TaxID=56438 RepID=UPI000B04918A|nr:putative Ig domain-containing protein [Couchioplanes caeruleus]
MLGANAAGAIADSFIVALKTPLQSSDDVAAVAQRLVGDDVVNVFGEGFSGFTVRLSERRARILAAHPLVQHVEQNRVVQQATVQRNATWGLDRVDERSLPRSGTYTAASDARAVHAYVIDSGIRIGHSQFGGRASYGVDFVDGGAAADCSGHGTHVAGTIGGAHSGLAKRVRLVAVRVLDCRGAGTLAEVVAGINWVTTHAVRPAVANMSLGMPNSASVERAVQKSINAGIVYVVAAGNEGTNACHGSPSGLAAAITVGATDSTDRRPAWSNYGRCVDLFAPGVNITSASSRSNSATATKSGTSMAAPHVAGAVAMIQAAHPGWSPSQIRARLISDATTGAVKSKGTGSPNRLLYVPRPPATAIRTTALPGGAVARGYSTRVALTRALTGRWSVASGNLPRGLSLSASGWISGTPGRAGKSRVTLRFTDFVPRSITRSMALTIKANAPVIKTAALPAATLGADYQGQLRTVDSRPGTWRLVKGVVPRGLTLTTKGTFAGIPNAAGSFTFTVRFADRYGQHATRAYKVVSRVNPPVIVTAELPAGEYEKRYSVRLQTRDRRTGTWALAVGELPAGLTLSTDGLITGTPTTRGAFPITLRFVDPAGQTATRMYSLLIDLNPPIIATTELPGATSGSPYTAQLRTQDQRPGTWSITDGTLPVGLTMTPAGLLAGTPATAGSTPLTLLFTDSLQRTASQSYALTVAPGPAVISTDVVPAGAVGEAYHAQLSLIAARPGMWSIGQGTLPPGLTLSPTGAIAGTPTGAASITVAVRFTDSNGFIAERLLTVTVNPPPSTLVTQTWNTPFGDPALSADGRYVAFRGISGSQRSGVIRHDLATQTRVSGYAQSSVVPAISADGKYIVANASSIWSRPATFDAFYQHEPITTGWSHRAASLQYNSLSNDVGGGIDSPAVSANGRYVAFASTSTDVVRTGGQQTTGSPNIYLRDMDNFTTRLVSTAADGSFTGSGRQPSISADGRYVAFTSDSANLVADDTNHSSDIFVRDMTTGAISLISRTSSGAQRTTGSTSPAISADGRYVAYVSNGVHIHDLTTGTTTTVIAGGTTVRLSLSTDGRYLAFDTDRPGPGDTNGLPDVFRWDQATNTSVRISTPRYDLTSPDMGGTSPSLSGDGRRIAFVTSTRLHVADTDGTDDVYVQNIPA